MKRLYAFVLFLLCFSITSVFAQDVTSLTNSRYTVQMDIRDAYISGVCIMHQEEDIITASIMNEFGVSALTYRYNTKNDKVKILSIVKQMDKWYIKRILKKDLKTIMHKMPINETLIYENKKYHIKYLFTPLRDEIAEFFIYCNKPTVNG